MRRVLAAVAVLSLTAITASPVAAETYRYKLHGLETLRLHLSRSQPAAMCSKSYPANVVMAILVRVGRYDLPRPDPGRLELRSYYANHGTLVRSQATRKAGPICFQAMTWNRTETVTIEIGNLGRNPQLIAPHRFSLVRR